MSDDTESLFCNAWYFRAGDKLASVLIYSAPVLFVVATVKMYVL